MNITPYYESTLFQRSRTDDLRFQMWTGFLPERQETTPCHSGAHSIRNFEMAYDIVARPRRVLEIGFCLGHSACIWLNIGVGQVTSIENSLRPETYEAAERVKSRFGSRFEFVAGSSDELTTMNRYPGGMEPTIYDLGFIDGAHDVDSVRNDTALMMHLKVPYILFDDWFTHWSEGVQPAVEHFQLVPLAILGSMALCVPAKNLP